MGKSISTDLRLRLLRGVERDQSRRAVAAQFEVSPSTAVRVQSRHEKTGSVEPARQGRPKDSGKLGGHRGFLVAAVEARPDITMPAQVPFGKWTTQTFIAGLRCDGLVAPWVIDGASDGEAFDIYVQTQLAPTLLPEPMTSSGAPSGTSAISSLSTNAETSSKPQTTLQINRPMF